MVAQSPLVSIKNNREIRHLISHGRRYTCDGITVFYYPNQFEQSRLAVAVKKKVGKAVIRNLVKRRIKDIFRAIKSQLTKNYDLLVLVNPNQAVYLFESIKVTLLHICTEQAIIKNVNTSDCEKCE